MQTDTEKHHPFSLALGSAEVDKTVGALSRHPGSGTCGREGAVLKPTLETEHGNWASC
jgi:hypothetical protein